ncbi:MAG: 23S rRNA (pseudouridine(1915)-N(3))-methyltransferase RlmH, partial [Pseudomonadota bacterium]
LNPPKAGSVANTRTIEAQQLAQRISNAVHVVALDSRGKAWSTAQLAQQLERWQMHGQPVHFLIGGANGLDDSILKLADQRWSLGPLTLPHMLVRVLLAEQLYRAWTITQGHPYHRA